MTTKQQKDFNHMLFRMQNGTSLTIGPLGELNYEMATDVSNVCTTFSIYALFENSSEKMFFTFLATAMFITSILFKEQLSQ